MRHPFYSRLFMLWLCSVIAVCPPFKIARAEEAALTLEESIRLALLRNERARIADGRVETAVARVARARAFFFPDLTASGRYGRRSDAGTVSIAGQTFTSRDPDILQATVSVSMPVFDARAFPLYRQAKLDHEAARFSRTEEKRLLAFEVTDAYLQTLSVEQVQASAERRLAFARRTVEDTKARFEAKLVSLNDLTRAELELATAQREATLAQGEVELFRMQLGYLIDSEINRPLVVPEELLDPPAMEAPDRLVKEARARRLDLAADRARIQALSAFATEPARRILPILGFNSEFQQTFEAGPDDKDWFVGLNLTWMLYDGGERRADRSERLADARIADLELIAASRQVDLDVRRALIAIQNDRAVAQQALAAVEISRKNVEEATILYREGLASALEAADANLRSFESEVALVRARYGLGLSLINLRAALGLDPLGNEVIP